MNDQRVMLNEADLGRFMQKLATWAQTLNPDEQAFLHQMLADAADAASEDVSGFVNLRSIVRDEEEDEVQGFSMLPGQTGAILASVSGYARGLERDAADTLGAFDTD